MRTHRAHITLSILLASAGGVSAVAIPAAAHAQAMEREELETLVPPTEGSTEAEDEAEGERSEVPCPIDVPETVVFAVALDDGAALLFLAPTAPRVAEVRRRVRALAEKQNEGARLPPGEREPTALEQAEESDLPREPIATAHDIRGGAMLHFAPSNFDDLSEVQGNVLEYAQRLAGGECPLMRDEVSLLPARAPSDPDLHVVPMPGGIIPNVGGLVGVTPLPLGAFF